MNDGFEELGGCLMDEWKSCGIVAEGYEIDVVGVNSWDFRWDTVTQPPIELPHPAYPSQRHRMWIYSIECGDKKIVFAAGELSANVWGFYLLDDDLSASS